MSSQYGPYGLGYTGDTKIISKSGISVNLCKSLKIKKVRIIL